MNESCWDQQNHSCLPKNYSLKRRQQSHQRRSSSTTRKRSLLRIKDSPIKNYHQSKIEIKNSNQHRCPVKEQKDHDFPGLASQFLSPEQVLFDIVV